MRLKFYEASDVLGQTFNVLSSLHQCIVFQEFV